MIDIAAATNGAVISEQLKRNDLEDRKQILVRGCERNEVIGTLDQVRFTFVPERDDDPVARFHFFDIVQNLFVALMGFRRCRIMSCQEHHR